MTRKLVTAAAVSLALAGATGSAIAEITGVPAEAQLGPMVLFDPAVVGNIETYIALTVPLNIGNDTVVNLSAPHVLANGPTAQINFDPRIHWTLFDENSDEVEDGECFVSPGDTVMWTTDTALQAIQNAQTAAMQQRKPGTPDSFCGPSSPERFGYVVFQTYQGADGLDADFAFWAQGAIVDSASILAAQPNIGAIPMLGMADGADPSPPGSGQPSIDNSVINNGNIGDGNASNPVKYAPILAGVRMNNSDAVDDLVYMSAPIQGVQLGNAMSLHVFWFDRNDATRVARTDIWDDQEGSCSYNIPMPRELNLWMFNHRIAAGNLPPITAGAPNWANMAPATAVRQDPTRGLTDVISAVKPSILTGYASATYCLPPYWNANVTPDINYLGALGGYVAYEFDEINDPQPVPGVVNSAAAAFNWQEAVLRGPAAWSMHMTIDQGKY
jgi:hypothetical protein